MDELRKREYLENRVKTASSAQLHLMLIDGAIRFAREAGAHLEANNVDAAAKPLLRAMDIASELLAGVKHSDSELNEKLAALYQFVFTRMTMAYVNTSRENLAEALGVLEFERETWRQAVAKLSADGADPAPAARGPHQPISLPATDMTAGGGLSLEV